MYPDYSSFPTLAPEELDILAEIKKELSLDNYQQVISVVAGVLLPLRQCLSLTHARELLNAFPDFLKLIFTSNWKLHEPSVNIRYLDEFVYLVMCQNQKERKLFKSEVQALTTVVVVLKKLNKLVDLGNFEGLSPAFRNQLNEIPSEVAA